MNASGPTLSRLLTAGESRLLAHCCHLAPEASRAPCGLGFSSDSCVQYLRVHSWAPLTFVRGLPSPPLASPLSSLPIPYSLLPPLIYFLQLSVLSTEVLSDVSFSGRSCLLLKVLSWGLSRTNTDSHCLMGEHRRMRSFLWAGTVSLRGFIHLVKVLEVRRRALVPKY